VDRPAGMSSQVPPEVGFDVLRDAVALIGCSAAGDDAGFAAVIGGSGHHVDLAGMTATIAAMVCRRAGLDADVVLGGIRAELSDLLLDQAAPVAEAARHG
jgi:hypothetical protein